MDDARTAAFDRDQGTVRGEARDLEITFTDPAGSRAHAQLDQPHCNHHIILQDLRSEEEGSDRAAEFAAALRALNAQFAE